MRNLILTVAALAAATPAWAGTTIFAENFDTVRPQTYGVGDMVGQFRITAGDLDVIGNLNGQFFGCPGGGNNNCVDTNGNHPATFSAAVNLIAGNAYRVSFDIAGNGPRDSNLYELAVGLGTSAWQRFTSVPQTEFRTVSFDYVATSTGAAQLEFQSLNTDLPGYWGMLVDNVKVEDMTTPSAVPEPASWAMLMFGFGGLASALRSRKTREMAIA